MYLLVQVVRYRPQVDNDFYLFKCKIAELNKFLFQNVWIRVHNTTGSAFRQEKLFRIRSTVVK